MDPLAAAGAATRESEILPPGSDEWIVDLAAVVLEAEVDGLEVLVTAEVGALGVRIDYMGRHLSLRAAAHVGAVHCFSIRFADVD